MSIYVEKLLHETEEARKDPVLISFARGALSAEDADTRAEEYDYPTYLCRQARLLVQLRNTDREAWCALPHDIEAPKLPFARVHEYPCEWEREYHGITLNPCLGTLVVAKNSHEAPLLWDYTLLDENREVVCFSDALGREWHSHPDFVQVNCFLNSGSRLLPRKDLTIRFNSHANSISFSRVRADGAVVKWSRSPYDFSGNLRLRIERVVTGKPQQEHHRIELLPLTPELAQELDFSQGDDYALLLEKHFFRSHDEAHMLKCVLTTLYSFSERRMMDSLTGDGTPYARRCQWSGPLSLWRSCDVAIQVIKNQDLSPGDYYVPHSKSVEDVVVAVDQETPQTINLFATLLHMCDLRETDDFIYYDDGRKRHTMLVKV